MGIDLEPVRIIKGYVIRDGSGRYGCPACWKELFGANRPGDSHCNRCGVPLVWDLEAEYGT